MQWAKLHRDELKHFASGYSRNIRRQHAAVQGECLRVFQARFELLEAALA